MAEVPAARRRPGRPATGQVPTRSVRVGPVWDAALVVARRRGDSLSVVIATALEQYVREESDARRPDPRAPRASTDQG
ncbi:MAG: hypothetical protein ACRDRX_04350 [Pseudonocardiaceae bacterium]